MPVSAITQLNGAFDLCEAHSDAAFEGVLERVGNEIENNLLPHLPIHVDCHGECRALDVQAESAAFNHGAKIARQLGGKG